MILLSVRLPEKEVEIVFTGLRSGEKLKEELFHPEEVLSDTGYDKILLAATRSVDAPVVMQDCLALEQACSDYNELQIEAIINRLVPEYQWGEWNNFDASWFAGESGFGSQSRLCMLIKMWPISKIGLHADFKISMQILPSA